MSLSEGLSNDISTPILPSPSLTVKSFAVTLAGRSLSTTLMVFVALLSSALTGLRRTNWIISSNSSRVSSIVTKFRVFDVSPGSNTRVPFRSE